MPKLPQFQFKSITHRLIFGCVIAGLFIYSGSYWHMRKVVQLGVVTWMMDVAQSRIDAVTVEIEGIVRSLEQNTDSIIKSNQSTEKVTNQNKILLIQTLIQQQPLIKAVAVGSLSKEDQIINSSELLGFNTNTLGKKQVMKEVEIKNLLNYCQNNSKTPLPFWSNTDQEKSLSKFPKIIYCTSFGQEKVTQNLLAMEVTLDWLKPLVTRKLYLEDKVNHFSMGEPFVINLATKQWLVTPSETIRSLTWFSQKYTTIPEFQSKDKINKNSSNPQIFTDFQGTLIFSILPETDWGLGIAFPETQMKKFRQNYLWIMIISMMKDLILICLAIMLISRQTTRSLRALILSTENIAQGNLNTILPVTNQRDEVGRLTAAFHHMRDALKTYIKELQKTTATQQKMESELSIAAQIQRSMIPRIEVIDGSNQHYEISALFQPARLVGGDLYDFFSLNSDQTDPHSNRLCLIIGDVADKGVPAALLMARTVSFIRTITKSTSTPEMILKAVNHELCIDNEECLFVTLFCAVLDLQTGILNYASAGHDAPLLLREGKVHFLDLETGPPLGLEEDAFFVQQEYLLKPNDLIVLYTDGITEAMNVQGDMFSEERLINAITNSLLYNPARVIHTIQYFHQQFINNASQSDDLTLLVLQYQPLSSFYQEMNILEWTITINNELTELERVKPHLGKILRGESLTVESIEDTQLIVEEILVNIINYGGDHQSKYSIDLQIKIGDQSLILIFQDSGKPFNPLTEIEAPDLSMNDEEREQGGLGFYLVRELVDQIDYTYAQGKNILTIYKTITKKM
ncbi:SpoIIE family protein phosphatase [Geminocystis sp. GBBB08]|uniref:ATP-binding SpoIIE family protein phosphatase n=1 Tax=Geminocystis sp. GBBB08 TaxID=2604140 RepID=UPI0027E319E7|nr:SpoIIE family protein phosphatase [Geminocystis sp. GBBB08]MBL1209458.1 SpoIIE family protein phosphatase [Geminocystis sp. GBBB08]